MNVDIKTYHEGNLLSRITMKLLCIGLQLCIDRKIERRYFPLSMFYLPYFSLLISVQFFSYHSYVSYTAKTCSCFCYYGEIAKSGLLRENVCVKFYLGYGFSSCLML